MIKLLVCAILLTIFIVWGTIFVLPKILYFGRDHYSNFPIISNLFSKPQLSESFTTNDFNVVDQCNISGCSISPNHLDKCSATISNENIIFDCSYTCDKSKGECTEDACCNDCGSGMMI